MSTKEQVFAGATKVAEGLSFNGAIFLPIIDKCEGCARIRTFEEGQYCSSYPMPEAKWSMGNCNFSTHTKVSQERAAKVNPLKASKRSAKGH